MATVYRCDRCGHEQDKPLEVVWHGGAGSNYPSPVGDVCHPCAVQLHRWLRGDPPTDES